MIVERFLTWIETASPDQRPKAARALARAYLTGAVDEADIEAAEAAMTLLLDDPVNSVRTALAEELASDPAAPRHIIAGLAADEPQIAMLVLARSPVFLDGDLVDIAASGSSELQIAIACRPFVSAGLGAALAEIGTEEACLALLMNEAAETPLRGLHRIAERHGANGEIRRQLARREELLPETKVELIERLGETLRERHGEHSWMSPSRLDALVAEQCDKAFINYASTASEHEQPAIVAALIARGKVTAAFLLRTICLGNIALFSAAIGALAQAPAGRAETALGQGRRTAFRALYLKAGLPQGTFDVFDRAIALWRGHLAAKLASEPTRLPFMVTRELLSEFSGRGSEAVDGLLVLLRKLAAETARDHARHEARRLSLEAQRRKQNLLAAPRIKTPEELWPPVDVPAPTLAAFAGHFAEELLDLEEELAAEAQLDLAGQIAAIEEVDAPVEPDTIEIANDEHVPVLEIDPEELRAA